MYPRITHIALHVKNIKACIHFYQDFCNMNVCHRRQNKQQDIVWMAEPGRESEFVFVFLGGGEDIHLANNDYRHFGFAVDSKDEVDAIAKRAKAKHCLVWAPKQEKYPVGYYCGLKDPNGNYIEFSYGQPLGPGSEKTVFE